MNHSNSMLRGTKVVEIAGSIKSSYCGRILAHWGADVVRIEDMESGAESQRESETRPWLHASKRSVQLRLDDAVGVQTLLSLIESCDVLTYDRDALPELVCDRVRELLASTAPHLIAVELSDFGSSGPWSARASSDLVVSALSGMCKVNQAQGGPPLREPGNQAYVLAGVAGAFAVITALINRHHTGRGQTCEVSALETLVNVLSPQVLQVSYQGGARPLSDGRGYLFECMDGWVSLVIVADSAWQLVKDIWEIEVDPSDDRFSTERARRQNLAAIRELLKPALERRTRREIFEDLAPARIVCGMLMRPGELFDDPHLVARRAFTWGNVGNGERTSPFPRFPVRVAGELVGEMAVAPAPRIDTFDTWSAKE